MQKWQSFFSICRYLIQLIKKSTRKIHIILQGLDLFFSCFNTGNALLFTMTKELLVRVCVCVCLGHTRAHTHILVCKTMYVLRGLKLTVFTLFFIKGGLCLNLELGHSVSLISPVLQRSPTTPPRLSRVWAGSFHTPAPPAASIPPTLICSMWTFSLTL